MSPRARRWAEITGAIVLAYLALQRLWPTPAGVVAQGIVVGSLTALIAFGLALIYRSSRVINFAQADLGSVPAALAIMFMLPRMSGGIGGPRLSYWVAMPLALVVAVALGSLVELVFIRRFSKAPRLIVMVVTIGLSQILAGLGTAIPWWFGSSLPPQRYPSPFDFSFTIDPIVFRGNDLMAVIVTAVAIAALLAFLRYTRIGIAIRASAESADRASLLGINVGRTQNVAWIVATVLATIAMILRAGIVGLPIGSAFGPMILLRALAAAVIGRMEDFGVMFLAACGLGVVETAILWNKGSTTLVDPVVFVILLVALLLQRRNREARTEDQATSSWQTTDQVRSVPRELRSLPEVRWAGRALAAAVGAIVLALPLVLSDGKTNLAAAVFIYSIIAVSLVVLTGWAGEISLGQVAFVAIGSAVAGALNVHQGWDLLLTTLVAACVGAAASVVIGLPALRIRGLFLAVTTMSFALVTSSYLLNRNYFGYLPDNLTERVVRRPLLGRTSIRSETAMYYVCLAGLLVVLWLVHGLRNSRTGRVLVAARENERGAQAFGVNLTRTKLLAFAISGFFASFAGGLFVVHQQAVGQEIFAPTESIRVLTMVVVGGLGSVPGAIFGAVFLKSTEWFNTMVPQQFRFLFTFAGSGMGLILVLWFFPGGLGSLLYRVRDGYLRWVAQRRGIAVPSLFADTAVDDPSEPAAAPVAVEAHVEPLGQPGLLRHLPARPVPAVTYLTYPDVAVAGTTPNLLSIRSLDVSYGQVQVLFGVNLEVTEGEIIALLGTNGAGKSTVLRAISGLVTPRSGSVTIEGSDITGMAPHRIAGYGVAQVPGGRGIFPSLTVAEHLRAASWSMRDDARSADARNEAFELFPVLATKLDQPAANLSGGQQQMLALAMAFMTKPRLLMIDELSLGLAPIVVEQLLEVVLEMRRRGTTIILVEQSVNVALTVAETAYFMEKGEIRFHGPTAELLARPDILRSVFLEGASASLAPARTRPRAAAPDDGDGGGDGGGSTVLATKQLVKSFRGVRAIDDVSIRVGAGEIVGVIGPNGAGKTTLFDLLSGFLLPASGSVEFDGRDVTTLPPDRRSLIGLARSFQDARLFGALTVHQVLAVALDRELGARDPVAAAVGLPSVADAERKLGARADELLDLLNLGAYRDKFVSDLSTGSRRIVDLACLVGMEPKVILFDEPSSGVAQRETEQLGPLLLRIRDETGAALVVIEHDMPLITSMADRIVALDLGRVIAEGPAEDVLGDDAVVASYLGSSREAIERSGRTAEAVEVAT